MSVVFLLTEFVAGVPSRRLWATRHRLSRPRKVLRLPGHTDLTSPVPSLTPTSPAPSVATSLLHDGVSLGPLSVVVYACKEVRALETGSPEGRWGPRDGGRDGTGRVRHRDEWDLGSSVTALPYRRKRGKEMVKRLFVLRGPIGSCQYH